MLLLCRSASCVFHNRGKSVSVKPVLKTDAVTRGLKASCPDCGSFLGYVSPSQLDEGVKIPSERPAGFLDVPAPKYQKRELTREEKSKLARHVMARRKFRKDYQLDDLGWENTQSNSDAPAGYVDPRERLVNKTPADVDRAAKALGEKRGQRVELPASPHSLHQKSDAERLGETMALANKAFSSIKWSSGGK